MLKAKCSSNSKRLPLKNKYLTSTQSSETLLKEVIYLDYKLGTKCCKHRKKIRTPLQKQPETRVPITPRLSKMLLQSPEESPQSLGKCCRERRWVEQMGVYAPTPSLPSLLINQASANTFV